MKFPNLFLTLDSYTITGHIVRNITDDSRQFGLPYENTHCAILQISCKHFSIN